MANKYLIKVADMIRGVEGLVGKTKALNGAILNRERKINMGFSSKPDPVKAKAKLDVLKQQSDKKLWN